MRQSQALTIMMRGTNVFLTGPPGSGKTFVLNQFVDRAEQTGLRIAVTASTGIAATHIGGSTIHSWSGLGIRDHLSQQDEYWLMNNDRLAKRYNGIDVLIIDEVSMLHGSRLDMLNRAAKLLRRNEAAFGGLQVILVGDLFQLPPVNRDGEEVDFAHTSAAWKELELDTCYLSEQHRQIDDDGLLDLLTAMRSDRVNESHELMLSARLDKSTPTGVTTRLFAHNVDVDVINQRQLDNIPKESKLYTMETKGSKAKVDQLVKSILAPERLELKVGAEVMFVANNFAGGFANGSRGRVIDFKGGWPRVRLNSGRIIKTMAHEWTLNEDNRVKAEAYQLPLRLAWAITIHKSQGMSLDAAEIDLSRAFTPGMGYVALSRVRSLDGLYLSGVNRMALSMHPLVMGLDDKLIRASNKLAEAAEDIAEEVATKSKKIIKVDDGLFKELKTWRLKRSIADKLPPYIIAHDSTLTSLAVSRPTNPQQLLAVTGFGPYKVETYGSKVLAVIKRFNGR